MKRSSDNYVKVLVFLSIAVMCLLSATFASWKFQKEFGGVRVNDVLTVRVRGRDRNVLLEMSVDVREITTKGELIVAADRRIRINDEVWTISLSGRFPRTAIRSDGIVESEDIFDLAISKTDHDDGGFTEESPITKQSGSEL
jgi:flagellar basal body L-ring protein FlgH